MKTEYNNIFDLYTEGNNIPTYCAYCHKHISGANLGPMEVAMKKAKVSHGACDACFKEQMETVMNMPETKVRRPPTVVQEIAPNWPIDDYNPKYTSSIPDTEVPTNPSTRQQWYKLIMRVLGAKANSITKDATISIEAQHSHPSAFIIGAYINGAIDMINAVLEGKIREEDFPK